MNYERLSQALNQYLDNTEIFFPIILSFLILLIAVGFIGRIKDSTIRNLLLLPLAGIFLWLGFLDQISAFEQDYFLNLSTEIFGALAAMLVFAGFVTSSGWTFPFIGTILFVISILLAQQAVDNGDAIAVNLSTELLGAFITTALLKREWLYNRRNPYQQMKEQIKRRSQRGKLVPNTFYVLAVAETPKRVKQNMVQLRERGIDIQRSESITQLPEGLHFSQLMCSLADTVDQDDPLLTTSNQASVVIRATPDTAKAVYDAMRASLTCQPTKPPVYESPTMVNLHITAEKPAAR